MKIQVLFGIIVYYLFISLVYVTTAATFPDFTGTNNITINETTLNQIDEGDIDKGGLFNIGVSFTRYLGFVSFGFGLPSDTPAFAQALFTAWTIIINLIVVAFIISAIWDG